LRRFSHFLERKPTFAFDGSPIAKGEKAAEATIGGPIGGIADGLEAIGGNKPCTDK
jgi:hypothetical protein